MKTEIDELMKSNQIAALHITGAADHNPMMVYFTGLRHVSQGDLIKKPDEKGILFHIAFERDEAASTGLNLRCYDDFPYKELLAETGGDKTKVEARRLFHVLESSGITAGKVALYGQADAGKAYSIIQMVKQYLPEIEFVADWQDAVLLKAMITKDESELDQIRKMGKITTSVVGKTADFLSQHKARHDQLVKTDGEYLTIGDVKQMINLWLAEAGAENPEGTIFSIGHDSAVPHSAGNATDTIRLGQTIVFDIFPCQAGGGYFYDFTRTWCMGYAPDAVIKLYQQVKLVYDTISASLKEGELCAQYQANTCDLFEKMGHPTIRSHKNTVDGYNHSIGHGLGLRVHEKPWFGDKADESDRLFPGTVFTVEPGLYYPEKYIGVRIEDTYCVTHTGRIEKMAEYPYDLILPIHK
jgi:Xaa-Pro aminopeptidase